MDSMLGENKNLKDISKSPIKDSSNMPTSYEAQGLSLGSSLLSYTKTNKLISALYMVTDMMEKDEPMRLKLRTLGIKILSDINSFSSKTQFEIGKIEQVLSFLSVASDVGMISEMNYNILKKEFTNLKESIQEFTSRNNIWLEGFINTSSSENSAILGQGNNKNIGLSLRKGKEIYKGQGTRIGLQKGSTLMKALDDVRNGSIHQNLNEEREEIKHKRRDEIISIVKNYPNGISIKDIMSALRNLGESWGEKTLQRELISMVKDNVLKKTGEKRWSHYFLNSL